MEYLLDTNICIYLIKKKSISVLEQLQQYQPEQVGLSAITAYELFYGVYRSQFVEKNLNALNNFLSPFSLLDFTDEDAMNCGRIRADLEKLGKMIGPYDIQIAAQALSNDLVLVTNNEKEFSRVEGLTIQNWAKP